MASTKSKPNADALRKVAEAPVLGGWRLWPWALMGRKGSGAGATIASSSRIRQVKH